MGNGRNIPGLMGIFLDSHPGEWEQPNSSAGAAERQIIPPKIELLSRSKDKSVINQDELLTGGLVYKQTPVHWGFFFFSVF